MANELKSQTDFEKMIKKGVTLVDFNAPWCGPCRAQEPVLNAMDLQYDGRADIATMNIDDHADVARDLGIQSIPTLILYKDGREVNRFVGLQQAKTLRQALELALTG